MPHLIHKRNKYVTRFRQMRIHHKLIFSLVGLVGVIFVWNGVWRLIESTPVIGHPVSAIFIGLALAAISGVIFSLF
jgi:hypothetical protein